jgi:hypothetical protein
VPLPPKLLTSILFFNYFFNYAGGDSTMRDGTSTFSKYGSGTCSHNGGVAEWL